MFVKRYKAQNISIKIKPNTVVRKKFSKLHKEFLRIFSLLYTLIIAVEKTFCILRIRIKHLQKIPKPL